MTLQAELIILGAIMDDTERVEWGWRFSWLRRRHSSDISPMSLLEL